jgi:hypothetical protein
MQSIGVGGDTASIGELGCRRVTIPVLTNRRALPINDTSTQQNGAQPVNRQKKLNHHHNEVAS